MLTLGLSTAEDDTAGPAQLALVTTSACPVVLVPDDLTTLGVNARHPVGQAVDFAFDDARLWDVRLHAVRSWGLPSCAAELPFEDVLLLSPTECLAHHAEGAALLVVGRGTGMGPDALQSLLREAGCPVAIVP